MRWRWGNYTNVLVDRNGDREPREGWVITLRCLPSSLVSRSFFGKEITSTNSKQTECSENKVEQEWTPTAPNVCRCHYHYTKPSQGQPRELNNIPPSPANKKREEHLYSSTACWGKPLEDFSASIETGEESNRNPRLLNIMVKSISIV